MLGLWATTEGKLLRQLPGLSERIDCCTFSPDGDRVVATAGNKMLWWDVDGARQTAAVTTPRVASLAFHPDGMSLMGLCYDGTLRVWDTETHRVILNSAVSCPRKAPLLQLPQTEREWRPQARMD